MTLAQQKIIMSTIKLCLTENSLDANDISVVLLNIHFEYVKIGVTFATACTFVISYSQIKLRKTM